MVASHGYNCSLLLQLCLLLWRTYLENRLSIAQFVALFSNVLATSAIVVEHCVNRFTFPMDYLKPHNERWPPVLYISLLFLHWIIIQITTPYYFRTDGYLAMCIYVDLHVIIYKNQSETIRKKKIKRWFSQKTDPHFKNKSGITYLTHFSKPCARLGISFFIIPLLGIKTCWVLS